MNFKRIIRPLYAEIRGAWACLKSRDINDGLAAIIYHDITDHPSDFSKEHRLSVFPETFRTQIRFMKKNFDLISPDDLLAGRIPKRAAMITFDDGFASYFKQALPILSEEKVPSIIFLNGGPFRGEIFFSAAAAYVTTRYPQLCAQLVVENSSNTRSPKPLLLRCSRDFLARCLSKNPSLKMEIDKYMAPWAHIKDLEKASQNLLCFFGNHLYNHEVPNLLNWNNFKEIYIKNEEFLRPFTNYREIFSFPFGQPQTSFFEEQVAWAYDLGAKAVFSSGGCYNRRFESRCLDRIPFEEFHSRPLRMWHQILRSVA